MSITDRGFPRHGGEPNTPEPVDHQVARNPVVPPERVVAAIGLSRHASVSKIVARVDKLRARLSDDGEKAIEYARHLAARGYPASTLGDGGSRATDDTSSTERLTIQGLERRDEWAGVDARLAAALAVVDQGVQALDALVANICHHAADLDRVPVGTGECGCCGRFCRPTKDRPGFRLRSGLCPACYMAWYRSGMPHPQNDWVRAHRAKLTDDQGRLHPEDDSTIDMSAEIAS